MRVIPFHESDMVVVRIVLKSAVRMLGGLLYPVVTIEMEGGNGGIVGE